ncbi:hypothetical protein BSQ39_05275 [Loigolactobacillus backii]|nr:hypothetical protein BSQ39_05275 [Loigolactobacillus backii]
MVFKKEWFLKTEMHKFEDTEMPIAVGSKQYMTAIFGDFMKLPNRDQQVAKHHTVYINLDEPYQKYKGIYYCKEI